MVVSKKEMMPAASDWNNLQRKCRRTVAKRMPIVRTKVASKERMPFAKRMPEASDNGSQPYSRAYGYGEMAGKRHHTRNLAFR